MSSSREDVLVDEVGNGSGSKSTTQTSVVAGADKEGEKRRVDPRKPRERRGVRVLHPCRDVLTK